MSIPGASKHEVEVNEIKTAFVPLAEPPAVEQATEGSLIPLSKHPAFAKKAGFLKFLFNGQERISTGIQSLDKILGGGLDAGLMYIGAKPGAGKTTLLVQVMDYIASQGRDCIYYSLEIGLRDILKRTTARLSYMLAENEAGRISMFEQDKFEHLTDFQQVTFSQVEKEILQVAKRKFIKTVVGLQTVEGIKRDIEKSLKPGIAPVVFIDYLQLLGTTAGAMADKARIDTITSQLKQMSWEFNIPIVVISSLAREAYKKTDAMPGLANFKESGGIEYSADFVLAMQEKEQDDLHCANSEKKAVECVALKSRWGITGASCVLDYQPKYAIFSDVENVAVGNAKSRRIESAAKKGAVITRRARYVE